MRQDVVQAAVADVVGPAVAADDPDALLHQVVGDASSSRCASGASMLGELRACSAATRSRCAAMPASVGLVGLEQRLDQRRRRAAPPSCLQQFAAPARACLSTARRMPKPNSALSSKSELDQAGPRPSRFVRVGRGRQVAAVDRGAAGGVGDERAVAEELGEQLDVGRLAAAGAGAGELEERLEELRALDVELELACGPTSGRSRKNVVVRRAPARAAAAAAPC